MVKRQSLVLQIYDSKKDTFLSYMMAKSVIKSLVTAQLIFYYRRLMLFTTFDIFHANIGLLLPHAKIFS